MVAWVAMIALVAMVRLIVLLVRLVRLVARVEEGRPDGLGPGGRQEADHDLQGNVAEF